MTTYSQPGIINVLDPPYNLVPNNSTPTQALANTQGLQAAINAAQSNCAGGGAGNPTYGGIIVIPSNDAAGTGGGTYFFSTNSPVGPAITISCHYPILILGTGNATKLVMLASTDLFEVNNVASGDSGASGGVTFQDLTIVYNAALNTGAAIRVTGNSKNVRLLRMVLIDCPVGVAFDASLQCSMINCLVWNENNSGNPVTLGIPMSSNIAMETYIGDCVFEAHSPSNGMGTALTIVNADEVRVVNLRIEGYAQGIAITPAVGYGVHLFFENVTAIPYSTSSSPTGGAALLIQPTGTGRVVHAVFVGCEFGQTENDTFYTGPGVLVDQSQTMHVIDQVRFVSCWASGWPGNGMQINGAVTQVEILGGCYSCNGQAPGAPAPTIGINITNPVPGPHSGIRIIGVACNNSVYNNEGGNQLPANQDYGISIASGATNVLVHQCDLTNNNNAGLRATSPDATVHVTDCAGYNDRATTFSTPPTSGLPFSASGTYGYCGRLAFYVWGTAVTGITIDTQPTTLTTGGFTLDPGETAVLNYTGTLKDFVAVGK